MFKADDEENYDHDHDREDDDNEDKDGKRILMAMMMICHQLIAVPLGKRAQILRVLSQ